MGQHVESNVKYLKILLKFNFYFLRLRAKVRIAKYEFSAKIESHIQKSPKEVHKNQVQHKKINVCSLI